MSVDLGFDRMALFSFKDSHCFDTRNLIDGLQLLKGTKNSDHVDYKNVRSNLKGSKDTNSFLGRSFQDGQKPAKPCLMVPKEEGSNEKIEVRKAKSVHFADTCGLALTSVSTLFDSDDDLFAFTNFSRNRGLAERNSFPSIKNHKQQKPLKQRSKFVNFVQPVTLPDFQQKLTTNNVGLENVVFREFSVYGTIVVTNLDFEKQVFVRYTTDGWKTNQDAKGIHVPGSSTGRTDTFSFEIPIPSGSSEECNIEFCIRYETSSGCHWDNNSGQNYKILFYRSKSCSVEQDDPDGFILGPASQRFAGYKM